MKTKKLVALLLAVVMVLGLGTTAFASSNEKVQINNMMVDASLVETQNEDVAEMEMVSPESTIATAAFDPSTNPSFAPIKNITVDWSNSTVEAAGAMQGRVRYNLTMPGAAGNLTGRTLTFTFSNRTSVTGNILVTMGGNSCSAAINESATMQVDLTAGEQLFTVEWNDAGTQKRVTCSLYVTTPEVASVNLTSLTVAGTLATLKDPEDTTVGGVTRYIYTAKLPTGTATTTLDTATVVVVPQNSSATMTLKNSDGTVAATGSKADDTAGTYTFSNVNFNAGTKTLTVAPNKMTDYGRIIMMLTALGIDASKLDAYGDGEPFKDASGKVVHNLVEELYKYNKGYTINGPIFALIALDMGNYTVPKDAKWTRQNLLKEILAHEYGSDGWGIDMVAMLMQSLYPYINDPTYGAQVKAKLQEGYDIILGYKAAPSVDPMGSDYSFYSWGTTNSEATAQVICAMCVMGVDVGYDPNFSDYANKQGVLYLWLNRFLCSNDSGFGHTDTGYNEMATYQSMYALQWYLGFFENGGAGFPYSLYYHQQDFSRALSKECAITKFTLEGQEGVISNREITIKVPDGMPLEKLTPEVTVSEGARLLAPAFPVTFVAGTPTAFTVQAEDGTTQQTFYVTPKYDASVKGKGTTLFTDTIQIQNEDLADKDMEDMQVTKNDDGTTDILITIVPGVDTTKLRFKADISYKATASIDVTGKSNVDLHDWTDVVITAEDGATTAKYRVKVVSQTFASITEFVIKVDGVEYGAEIKATGATGTIRFTGIPDTADLTRVTPTKITLGEGTTEVLPSASAPQNFAEGAEYTVKGEGLRTRTYSVVTSSKGGGGDDGDDTPTVNRSFAITSFKIGDTAAEIDDKNGIIKITLPYGTNLYQQAPKIETGSGCTVSPRSGQVVNLSLPVTYTLTRGDETRTYTVIVTLKKSASQLIWDKAAVKLNPSSYQTSPDLGKKEPERTYIPSTSQILSGMKVQVNGKDVTYQASGVSNWLTMTPDSYSAASTYRFRAEKGALKNIAANGYNGFGIQAGKLHIGITEKMDTARGLDLSLCPVPAAAQTAWKNKSGVVGVWKITCDSVSGGLTLTFDCAGQTGKLALAKYNEAKKCFEQVSEKKWSVSGTTLTASNLSAGIYGILKIG